VVLLGRVLWVLVALAFACTMAAVVIAIGLLRPDEFEDVETLVTSPGVMGSIIAVTAVLILGYVLVPAMLLIAVAEAYRLRSVLFYACAGGAAGLLCYYGSSLGLGAPETFLDHEGEVIAASGIAAGIVYWVFAGRNAGAWREPRASALSPRDPDRPRLSI
jgi:hypothetical protein